MNRHKLFFFFLHFLLLYPLSIKAQDMLLYQSDTSFFEIGSYCRAYVDEKAPIDFEQFKNLPDSLLQKTKSGTLTFGNATNAWVRLLVKNQTSEPLYLNFWGFGLTHIDLFTQNENGTFSVRQTGTEQNYANRDLKRGNIAINIGQSPKVVYIHLQSNLPLNSLVSLSALKPLVNTYYERDTFNAICLGILIAMALYNLFLFFSVRESLYLYYFVYIMMALWTVAEMNSTWRHFIGWGLGFGIRQLLIISGILFTMRFLNTRAKLSLGHKVLVTIIGLLCLGIVLDRLDWQPFSNQLFQVTALTCLLILPFLGILAYRQGNKSALPYTIAWTILIVSAIFNVLTTHGILPVTFWTRNIFPIGTCIETILLAFALAYRIKEYRDASESAQQLAIQRLKENEQLVNEQNKILEEKVQERTKELQASLEALKATQDQLVQKEKLASLGELTAGIAHEIQNPLNFVNNFSELSVDLAKELNEEMVKNEIDKAYIEEILGDLSQNQVKINHHGKRASSIVKGMLEHSRASTGVKELTDINKLADEYLRLSYHGLRAKDKDFNADFTTDFDENLPEIEVIPQDIGRVLLNLINNAFYAVNQRAQLSKGFKPLESSGIYTPSVFVTTQYIDNQIIIKVKDNGLGIPLSIKEKIFQPFFSTKPTGQGTGLGLSLAYDIVTKAHGGTLEVESTEGSGTTFIITLPIKTVS